MKDIANTYDYIIAGMGCAGLSLAVRISLSGKLKDKKILLVDKEEKNKNDRTWCFWENQPGLFDNIVYQKWERLLFHSEDLSREMSISPYLYKMIRGIDFYRYSLDIIQQDTSFDIHYGEVCEMGNESGKAYALIDGKTIRASLIFSSIQLQKPALKKKEHYLLQHFKGWVINTRDAVFDPGVATLMDFRVPQEQGTTFVYVMPFDTHRALVEYTLFSEALLEPAHYDKGLKNYIEKHLQLQAFEIEEEEFGIIPMTNHRFRQREGNIINIGTAGGFTKGSSGYTFWFIQEFTQQLVTGLLNNSIKDLSFFSKKHHFYDSVLLNVLATGKVKGSKIFTSLFRKNSSSDILRFLNNDGNLRSDLSIISSMPFLPFLRAGAVEIFNSVLLQHDYRRKD
ncbi:MAG: lycopene cyclase [Terrimonas sp.]|nr:lycopene cyclase [Terrimonas sp.]